MAIAAGVVVANIYYNQPLLAMIGSTFSSSPKQSGLIATLTQAGYAVGIFFLVPLADVAERRRMILSLTALSAFTLSAAALAPSIALLWVASLAIGIAAIVPQLLVPVTAYLARPEARGKAVGFVMSGLLIGILGARTVAGEVGQRFGWRWMFGFAAALMLVLLAVLWQTIPTIKNPHHAPWTTLMRSLIDLARSEPVLREAAFTGAMFFGAFSCFWATLVFRLGAPPFHYGARAAGLFGLVGISGALAAPLAGHSADRTDPRSNLRLAALICVAAFAAFWIGGSTFTGLIIGVILLDAGVQAAHITNQTRIFAINREAQNRLNTVYMTTYFVGGSLGSALGTFAWSHWQWPGVCASGLLFVAVATAALLRSSHALTAERDQCAA